MRSPRRRRSVAVAPALLDPAELPEDAAGRVRLISVQTPADVVDAPVARAAAAGPSRLSLLLASGDGWIPVAIAGIAITVIFVVGMALTH
jgi:hypothetical protein